MFDTFIREAGALLWIGPNPERGAAIFPASASYCIPIPQREARALLARHPMPQAACADGSLFIQQQGL